MLEQFANCSVAIVLIKVDGGASCIFVMVLQRHCDAKLLLANVDLLGTVSFDKGK